MPVSPRAVLPKFNYSANIQDISQTQIIQQLKAYFKFKNHHNSELMFTTEQGLCSGLVAYWMYCKCNKEEWVFIDQLEHLLNWQPSQMIAAKASQDPKIEDFINNIELLQFDRELRPTVDQSSIDKSFALILPDHMPKVATSEHTTTFVFTAESLSAFFRQAVTANKMIRISNAYHTVGLVHSGGIYYFYDPSAQSEPIEYDNTQDLAKTVFQALTVFCQSTDYIALNINVFDFESAAKNDYTNIDNFKTSLLENSQYKTNVLQNKDIFNLATWHKDDKLAKFLINENMNLNARNPKGRTPLELAIKENRFEIIYDLLAAGADAQLVTSSNLSLIDYAINRNNINALILLLAFGKDFTKEQIDTIKLQFKYSEAKFIFEHAVELQRKLLNTPKILNLDATNGQQIIAFLRQTKLHLQIDRQFEKIVTIVNNKPLNGLQALNSILEHCHNFENLDLYDCAQKTEILELLKYHLPANFQEQGDNDLLQVFTDIEKKFKSINPLKLLTKELQEISSILEHLSSIASHWQTIYPKRLYICYRAQTLKNQIEKKLALTNLHIQTPAHKRNYLFFTPDKDTPDKEVIFATDVAPMLKNTLEGL